MKSIIRILGVLPVALIGLAGCHEVGHVNGGPGDYGKLEPDVIGEIRYVNTRVQEIEVRTDSNRAKIVRFDDRTRVVYRDREYAVANLEPGDYVGMRTQQDRRGRLYTDLIRVRSSAREQSGGGKPGRLERLNGRVEYIDTRRSLFEVRDRDGKRVMVLLPYDPSRSEKNRFRSLREGDYVRLEGRFLNAGRFELESFL